MNTHNVVGLVGCLLALSPMLLIAKRWFPFDKHRPITAISLIFVHTLIISHYWILPSVLNSLIEDQEQELQMCLDKNKKIGVYKHLDLEN